MIKDKFFKKSCLKFDLSVFFFLTKMLRIQVMRGVVIQGWGKTRLQGQNINNPFVLFQAGGQTHIYQIMLMEIKLPLSTFRSQPFSFPIILW